MLSFILNNPNEKVPSSNYKDASLWSWARSNIKSKQLDIETHEVP